MFNKNITPQKLNTLSDGHFPGDLGIKILTVSDKKLSAELKVERRFLAPNGYLHAGSIVTFADTVAGYAAIAHLPENATSFTTVELKSNFIGTTTDGTLICECIPEHMGRTSHVWRAVVLHKEKMKKLAIFSCTQLILY